MLQACGAHTGIPCGIHSIGSSASRQAQLPYLSLDLRTSLHPGLFEVPSEHGVARSIRVFLGQCRRDTVKGCGRYFIYSVLSECPLREI